MTKIILYIIFTTLTLAVNAQWKEDFSYPEADFSSHWRGETTKFIIENGTLRLNDTTFSGRSTIYKEVDKFGSFLFSINYRIDFNPSSNNWWEVYFETEDSLTSYSLQVGGVGDHFQVVKWFNNQVEAILEAPTGLLNRSKSEGLLTMSFAQDSLMVTHEFYGDTTKISLITAFIFDSPIKQIALITHYTTTRSDKFWFDNISYTGTPYMDLKPPEVSSVHVLDSLTLAIQFSESLHFEGVQISGFTLSPLATAARKGTWISDSELIISFDVLFIKDGPMILNIPSVSDIEGNSSQEIILEVVYIPPLQAAFQQVIITEIMADPSPVVGPYPFEYIELYNASSETIDLSSFNLKIGDTFTNFLPTPVFPKEFVVLCKQEYSSNFGMGTKVIPITDWVVLNNEGQSIVIFGKDVVIDSLFYLASWSDEEKREGGWALEKKRLDYRCSDQSAWVSSKFPEGGSPGRINSVVDSTDFPIELLFYQFVGGDSISIHLNQPLFEKSIPKMVVGGEMELVSAEFISIEADAIKFRWVGNFREDILYPIELFNLQSCSTTKPSTLGFEVVIPGKGGGQDIIFNEILFDPQVGGSTFIELYNRSAHYLKIPDYWLEIYFGDDQLPKLSKRLNVESILNPDSYVVLSPYPEKIVKNYLNSDTTVFNKVDYPNLSGKEGALVLKSGDGTVIDSAVYSRAYHFQLLLQTKGVSLEKLSPEASSAASDSWHSAAASVGYGSPGRKNSRWTDLTASSDFTLLTPVLYYSRNGIREPMKMNYSLPLGNWVADMRVMDLQGNEIAHPIMNQTISNEGVLSWSGNHLRKERLVDGWLVVWIQLFNENGKVRTIKKVIGIRNVE